MFYNLFSFFFPGVSLRILGQAHCGWTRRELATDKLKSGRPQTNNIRYHAEEIYCDTVTDLVKNNNGQILRTSCKWHFVLKQDP